MLNVRKCIFPIIAFMVILAFVISCQPTKQAESGQTPTTADSLQTETESSSSANQNEQNQVQEELPFIELIMYLVGDGSPGCDEVSERMNDTLKNTINTTVELRHLPWADYESQYQLLFAANENFDCVYTASWTGYASLVLKNAYTEITKDMLLQLAPGILDSLPSEAWTQCMVNGKVYMVPTTYNEALFPLVTIRADLRKKYDIPEIKSWNEFEQYNDAILENEKDMIPLQMSTYYNLDSIWGQSEFLQGVLMTPFCYKMDDPNPTIFNMYELDSYHEYISMLRRWYLKGYWTNEVLLDNYQPGDLFENGRTAGVVLNCMNTVDVHANVEASNPDWELESFDPTFGKGACMLTAFNASGVGIPASSQNLERALKFIELARTNKELNQLLCKGIDGFHWKDIGNSYIDKLNVAPKDVYPDSEGLTWAFRNTEFQQYYKSISPAVDTVTEERFNMNIRHPLQGFNFNSTDYSNEIAAMTNIYQQYGYPLMMGLTDPEEGFETIIQKLNEAGLEKVMIELQKQADEFLNEFGGDSNSAW